MKKHSEIKWSQVVRNIITRQLDDLEEADRLASKSKLTQKDVDELAALAEEGVARRWKEILRETSH